VARTLGTTTPSGIRHEELRSVKLRGIQDLETIGDLLDLERCKLAIWSKPTSLKPSRIIFDYSESTQGLDPTQILDRTVDFYNDYEQELIVEYIYQNKPQPKAWKHGDYDGRDS
tara:strand:+ start:2060 stop:2401 length:342 start_codon:yes stop_codon:yes gene_type:complete